MPRKKKRTSYLEEYCLKVGSGKITACKKLKRICERLLKELKNGYKAWTFDPDAAMRAVEFIEGFCFIPSGKLGRPFVMELYERAWTEAIFGFVDKNGNRRFQEVFIEVGRKNGKTSWVAAVELYMLIADGEGAPQVYNAATSYDQATLAYNACNKMRLQSKYIAKHVTKQSDRLYCDLNMGYVKPIASNTEHIDGFDVHCGVLDEIHAMRDRDVYDLIKQGMGARDQPLLIQITTNGFVRNSIFDAQYDYASRWVDGKVKGKDADRFLCFIYELDDRDEWDDPKCWIKANPGLGTVKKREFIEGCVSRAKNDPTFKPTVMTKDFNMPENSSVAWLDFDDAVNVLTFDFREMAFRYGICGFDASDTIDLTCAQMLMMRPGDDRIYEKSMYWIPEDVIRADEDSGRRTERDGVPYQAWIARGLMRTVPGNKIDKRVLIEWLTELKEDEDLWTYAIGVDPWHMDDSTMRDLESFVGSSRVFKIRQGAQTLSQPMKQIKADYAANRIIDNHNPINEWCRMNVMVRSDANSNIMPDKKGLNPKNRIDGFAAELDAYITLCNCMDDYKAVI